MYFKVWESYDSILFVLFQRIYYNNNGQSLDTTVAGFQYSRKWLIFLRCCFLGFLRDISK